MCITVIPATSKAERSAEAKNYQNPVAAQDQPWAKNLRLPEKEIKAKRGWVHGSSGRAPT